MDGCHVSAVHVGMYDAMNCALIPYVDAAAATDATSRVPMRAASCSDVHVCGRCGRGGDQLAQCARCQTIRYCGATCTSRTTGGEAMHGHGMAGRADAYAYVCVSDHTCLLSMSEHGCGVTCACGAGQKDDWKSHKAVCGTVPARLTAT